MYALASECWDYKQIPWIGHVVTFHSNFYMCFLAVEDVHFSVNTNYPIPGCQKSSSAGAVPGSPRPRAQKSVLIIRNLLSCFLQAS